MKKFLKYPSSWILNNPSYKDEAVLEFWKDVSRYWKTVVHTGRKKRDQKKRK